MMKKTLLALVLTAVFGVTGCAQGLGGGDYSAPDTAASVDDGPSAADQAGIDAQQAAQQAQDDAAATQAMYAQMQAQDQAQQQMQADQAASQAAVQQFQ